MRRPEYPGCAEHRTPQPRLALHLLTLHLLTLQRPPRRATLKGAPRGASDRPCEGISTPALQTLARRFDEAAE